MEIYKTDIDGIKTVFVDDLTFLGDRSADFTWIQRHFWHHRLKFMLRNADKVVAGGLKTAEDLVRYYFISREKIFINDGNAIVPYSQV